MPAARRSDLDAIHAYVGSKDPPGTVISLKLPNNIVSTDAWEKTRKQISDWYDDVMLISVVDPHSRRLIGLGMNGS